MLCTAIRRTNPELGVLVSSRRQTRPSPSPKITPWGHFWKPALGGLRLDERKKRSVDPSLAFVESCLLRFNERAVVVATVFGPDGEENSVYGLASATRFLPA